MGFSAFTSAQSQSLDQSQSPVQNQAIANKLSDAQQQHVLDLIERVTPGYSSQFVLEYMPATQDGEDQYEITSKDGKVLLRGNNPIALSSAYYWYLKYNCRVQLSWFGDQLNLPDKLPLPDKVESRTIQGKHRVNFNYCTLSYSAPWWTWERWEREIDMMAMNDINMPLQAIGLDAVWYETLTEMGFSDEEAQELFKKYSLLNNEYLTK